MENLIQCPFCKKSFAMTKAITQHLEAELKEKYQQESRELKKALKRTMSVRYENQIRKAQDRMLERARKEALESQETLSKEFSLKIAEKDKVIQDLSKQMKDSQKKIEQGSTQLQGEILERDIESLLREYFTDDDIEEVPVGVKGADLIQTVKFPSGKPAGKIIYEIKRVKKWQKGFIAKVKEDMRNAGIEIAVIASSEVLPEGINHFGYLDGIWITELKYLLGLATALRQTLLSVALTKMVTEGQGKAGLVWEYVTSVQFRQRLENLVEAFVEMRIELDNEKRVMERQWAKREKEIERVVKSVAGIWGDLQGLAGLPELKQIQIT